MRISSLQYFLDTCADNGFIPKMRKINIHADPFIAIYKQNTEYFHVHPKYWHPKSMKDAALLFLQFNLFLLEKGFYLHDAHSHNFVMEQNGRVKWCDIGSIKKMSFDIKTSDIDECIRYLIYPIALRQKSWKFNEWARLSFANGLTHDLAREFSLFDPPPQIKGPRKRILESLKEWVESVHFDYPQTTWSNYLNVADWHESILTNARTKIFHSIFNAIAPKTAIDIAANSGFFSVLMARQGTQVLALDPDEGALAQLHAYLSGENASLKLKFAVDRARTTYTGAVGDLAIALALTHHLFISQKFSWPLIAHTLASYTHDYLLTEFMPNGLSCEQRPATLPAGYHLDIFRTHLERYFESCEIIEYPIHEGESPRIFLLCKGKKTEPTDVGKPFWAFEGS
ncbi:MAG: hypothetical protein LBO64_08225 [Desulfovibrio sp.]|nr:hypothetical protein [Desulfovibrio sp.]